MQNKCIIFDADGVLYNAETLSHLATYDVLKRHNGGLSISSEYMSSNLIGIRVKNQRKVLENLFKNLELDIKFPEDFDQARDKRQDELFEEIDLQPIDGIVPVLDYLKESKIPFFIGSRSRIGPMKKKLAKTGLDAYFANDKIYYPEAVTKEHWEQVDLYRSSYLPTSLKELQSDKAGIFLSIALANNFDPDNCLVLEDTESGLKSATDVNMHALGIAITDSAKFNLRNTTGYDICEKADEILQKIKTFLSYHPK